MPIHDWSRVPAGLFHDFHQGWSIRIKDSLNNGRLPKGLSALVEQRAVRANRIVVRQACGQLAHQFDEVMRRHVQSVTGTSPW